MINKTQPLSDYVAQYREGGVDVAAFPTESGKGNRYALRIVDPENTKRSLGFLASFSKKVKEADRPSKKADREKANKALDAILNDPSKMARFSVCFCVIDTKSLEQFPDKYTEEDLGREFISISYCGSVEADYDRNETKVVSVEKD